MTLLVLSLDKKKTVGWSGLHCIYSQTPALQSARTSQCVWEGEQQLLLAVVVKAPRTCSVSFSGNECKHVVPVLSEEQSLSAGLIHQPASVCVCQKDLLPVCDESRASSVTRPSSAFLTYSDITLIQPHFKTQGQGQSALVSVLVLLYMLSLFTSALC